MVDAPEYPAFKSRPQDIAVPHPEFRVSGKVSRGNASSQLKWGGLRVAPLLSARCLDQARAQPTPNLKETKP